MDGSFSSERKGGTRSGSNTIVRALRRCLSRGTSPSPYRVRLTWRRSSGLCQTLSRFDSWMDGVQQKCGWLRRWHCCCFPEVSSFRIRRIQRKRISPPTVGPSPSIETTSKRGPSIWTGFGIAIPAGFNPALMKLSHRLTQKYQARIDIPNKSDHVGVAFTIRGETNATIITGELTFFFVNAPEAPLLHCWRDNLELYHICFEENFCLFWFSF